MAAAPRAAGCVSGMRFSRPAGDAAGTLTWRGPALAFRVYRNGTVIGQTGTRRMHIRVSPGRRYSFVVRAVGAACEGRLVRRVAWHPPARPRGLGVENVTDRSLTLRWLAVPPRRRAARRLPRVPRARPSSARCTAAG